MSLHLAHTDPFAARQRAALLSCEHHALGVDPGLTGAIARLGPDGLEVEDMPRLASDGRLVDAQALFELPILYTALPGSHATIEAVHAMPRQGVASAFNFGRSVGRAEGVLACLFGPSLHAVTPQVWKFGVGLRAIPGAALKDRKDASRALASRLFPDDAHRWKLAKHDGRAEAVLIAWYCWQTFVLRDVAP